MTKLKDELVRVIENPPYDKKTDEQEWSICINGTKNLAQAISAHLSKEGYVKKGEGSMPITTYRSNKSTFIVDDKDFNEYLSKKDWKDIIYRNGKINLTQVFKELADYAFLMEQASKVYCHFVNLSKTSYYANTIISLIEEKTYDKEITKEDVFDILKSCGTKEEIIKEIKNYFELPSLRQRNYKERVTPNQE